MTELTPVEKLAALPPTSYLILLYFSEHSPTDVPNVAIARAVGRGLTSVRMAVSDLEDAGFIEITRRRRDWRKGDPAGRTVSITSAGLAAIHRGA